MSSPRVCIVILNWNGLADTQECLRSLQKVNYPNREVILVDNASTGDDVLQLTHEFLDSVRIIWNDSNHGLAEGSNIVPRYALYHSSTEYLLLLLLNNDTVVALDSLDEMITVAQSDPR